MVAYEHGNGDINISIDGFGVARDAGGLEGIVNGCDVNEWSPFSDKYLDVKYDTDTMAEGKAIAKETLQAELGLPVSLSQHLEYLMILDRAILSCGLPHGRWTPASLSLASLGGLRSRRVWIS